MTTKTNAILGWGAGGVMVASIIGGLLLIGGPGEARAKKEDAAILQAIQKTAKTISCYSDNIGALPEEITEIKSSYDDNSSAFKSSKRCRNLGWASNPVSQKEFEYNRLEDDAFELCAEFAYGSDGSEQYSSYGYYPTQNNILIEADKPRTDAGRHCYSARGWDKDAEY